MDDSKTSAYYRDSSRFKHPEVPLEEAQRVVANPVHTATQDDGKIRHYGEVSVVLKGKETKVYARVITLADGETIDNAFIDHAFTELMRSFTL